MFIVRRWSTELIVGRWTTTREVLQEIATTVVTDDDVELTVWTKPQHAAVVITTRRLAGVLLQRSQLDQVAIERERRAVPHVTIDTIAEHRYFVNVRRVDTCAA